MENNSAVAQLTKYIAILDNSNYGEWSGGKKEEGTNGSVITMPHVSYSPEVKSFMHEVYDFCGNHPEYEHTKYNETLEANNIDVKSSTDIDISECDAKCMIALIMHVIRAERFSEGALLDELENGRVIEWLKRLEEIDKENDSKVDVKPNIGMRRRNMAKNSVHIIPNKAGWSVKRSGAQRASVNTHTKAEAIKLGRVISQRAGCEMIIHGADGKVQEKR